MPEAIIGGVLVRPIHIAPAFRSLSATNESSFATKCSNAGEPAEQVMPLYFMLSLIVYGIPSRGPSNLPDLRRASLAAASSKTSGFSIGIELSKGPLQSYVNILSRYLATSSTAVIDPEDRASWRSDMLASTIVYGKSVRASLQEYVSFGTEAMSDLDILIC